MAIGAEFQQSLPQAGGHVDRLCFLARRDHDHVDFDVLLAEAFGRPHGVGLMDVVVGYQDDVRRLGPLSQEPARRGQIACADLDVVAPLG